MFLLPALMWVTPALVCLALVEGFWRATTPFSRSHQPTHVDARYGQSFEPGAEITTTNHVDYWTFSRANRWGFLEREPRASRSAQDGSNPPCRILLLGDALVEGAQVPLEARVAVVLEKIAKEKLGREVETIAIGYGDTGQANQLGYLRHFGGAIDFDLVVPVVAANDFANNSPILESVRNGWDPEHLPRYFEAPGETFLMRRSIDVEWQAYLLTTPADRSSVRTRLHDLLFDHSYFYAWFFAHLPIGGGLTEALSGRSLRAIQLERIRTLSARSEIADLLSGWRFPDDLDLDAMFFAEGPLPPVFEDALARTEHAFAEISRAAAAHGARMVVLGTTTLSEPSSGPGYGRQVNPRGGFRRAEQMLSKLGLPLIDQRETILAKHKMPEDALFRRERRWNASGHRWAAEAIVDYLGIHPEACEGDRREGSTSAALVR